VRNAIGKLWWLALVSRPDIICALHKCAVWQNKPSEKLWKHIIWIMRYLKQTKKEALIYKQPEKGEEFVAFCDSSFAAEPGSKSRYGYLFFVFGALVSWTSAHSTRVLTSSTEAECHALVHAVKENTWQKEFVQELGLFDSLPATTIFHNQSTIRLTENASQHKRSKHFGIEFDAAREYIKSGEVIIKYIPTGDMHADILTKSLQKEKFDKHKTKILGGREEQNVFR
jgi:hypothetical protein